MFNRIKQLTKFLVLKKNRIKTLVKIQLADQIGYRHNRNNQRLLVSIVIRIGIVIALVFILMAIFRFINGITMIRFNENMIGTIITILQIFAIVSCSVQLIHTLYISKENIILLSLPVKHNEIFISKLIVFYIYELRRNLYLLIPIYLGFGMYSRLFYGFGFDYILRVGLLSLIIPLFPVLIGAVISLPLVFIISFIKKRALLHSLITLGSCLVISLYIASSFSQIGKNLTPLEAWGQILEYVTKFTTYFNQHSLFYFQLNQILFGHKLLINFLIIGGLICGLTLMILLISIPSYFKMAVFPFDDATKKKYQLNMKVKTNSYYTFLSKELKMFFRSSDQVIGSFIYLIILPFLVYILNDLYTHLKPNEFGEMIILGVNVLIGLVLLLASNITSATAITREGSEFYLMKIVPATTYKIAWAKVTINLFISTIAIILTCISLALVNIIAIQNVIGIGVIFLLVNSGHILWSYELDLLKPRIIDYMSGQSMDDNPNATQSIIIGLVIAIIFSAITIGLLYDDYLTGWIRIIIIASIFLGARIYLFINRVNVYLERIEI